MPPCSTVELLSIFATLSPSPPKEYFSLSVQCITIHLRHALDCNTCSSYDLMDSFNTYLDVTSILAIFSQSCHDLIPPEVIEESIRVLANNFVSDRSSEEAQTVG